MKKQVEIEATEKTFFSYDNWEEEKEHKVFESASSLQIEGVVAREGVFNFPHLKKEFPDSNGKLYRPAEVLRKAVLLRKEVPLLIDHPPEGVVQRTDLVKGHADIYWDRNGNRVKGLVTFYKKDPETGVRVCSDKLLNAVKNGERRDVSIGYYHKIRRSPGKWGGEEYDFIEVDLWIDHLASVEKGRCTLPLCGLGLDDWPREDRETVEEMLEKQGDPFAGYRNWDECVKDQMRKGKSEESAKRICGFLEKKSKVNKQRDEGKMESEKEKLDEYPEEEANIEGDAKWTRAYINDLPDSAFGWIEPGGKKDGEGKTVPRSKRHFPYKDMNGKIDLPHVRNALARLGQGAVPQLKGSARQRLIKKLQSILARANKKGSDAYEEYKAKTTLDLVVLHRELHSLGFTRTGEHAAVVKLLKERIKK